MIGHLKALKFFFFKKNRCTTVECIKYWDQSLHGKSIRVWMKEALKCTKGQKTSPRVWINEAIMGTK